MNYVKLLDLSNPSTTTGISEIFAQKLYEAMKNNEREGIVIFERNLETLIDFFFDNNGKISGVVIGSNIRIEHKESSDCGSNISIILKDKISN